MAVSKKKLVFVSFITTILYSIVNIINETKLLKKNNVNVGSIFYYGFANNNNKLIAKGKHKNIPSPYLSSTSDTSYSMIPHDPTFLLHNNNNNKTKPELQFLPDEIDLLCGIPPGGKFPKELIGKGFGRVEEDSIKDVMRIRHHIEQHKQKQQQQQRQEQQNNETSSNDNNNKNVRLMCVVYTYSGKVKFTNAISETWGPRCDGILYASDHTSTETNHVEIPSFSVRGYKYAGLFQRVRAIMAYVYDEFLDQYDYFHFCGDDVFLIVENLKEFLGSKEVLEWESKRDHYLFAGFWMNQDISKDVIHKGRKKQRQGYKPSSNEFYLGGGSGYTLSRKSLKAYAEGPLQTCNTYEESPMEDIIFGHCIHEMTSNFFYTGDVDGSHRYHQGPVYMPIRYDQMRLSLEWMDTLPVEMTGLKEGVHQQMDQSSVISNSSVAFHRYYQPYELRRMELLLYRDFEKECAPYIQ